MATPNVATKDSSDTQRMGYGPRAAKTDDDTEGHVGQVSARSEQAMVQGLQRWTTNQESC